MARDRVKVLCSECVTAAALRLSYLQMLRNKLMMSKNTIRITKKEGRGEVREE